jgi:hypothetical protein
MTGKDVLVGELASDLFRCIFFAALTRVGELKSSKYPPPSSASRRELGGGSIPMGPLAQLGGAICRLNMPNDLQGKLFTQAWRGGKERK